jgi:hypothetical protein
MQNPATAGRMIRNIHDILSACLQIEQAGHRLALYTIYLELDAQTGRMFHDLCACGNITTRTNASPHNGYLR